MFFLCLHLPSRSVDIYEAIISQNDSIALFVRSRARARSFRVRSACNHFEIWMFFFSIQWNFIRFTLWAFLRPTITNSQLKKMFVAREWKRHEFTLKITQNEEKKFQHFQFEQAKELMNRNWKYNQRIVAFNRIDGIAFDRQMKSPMKKNKRTKNKSKKRLKSSSLFQFHFSFVCFYLRSREFNAIDICLLQMQLFCPVGLALCTWACCAAQANLFDNIVSHWECICFRRSSDSFHIVWETIATQKKVLWQFSTPKTKRRSVKRQNSKTNRRKKRTKKRFFVAFDSIRCALRWIRTKSTEKKNDFWKGKTKLKRIDLSNSLAATDKNKINFRSF